jgi:hypothetical protein
MDSDDVSGTTSTKASGVLLRVDEDCVIVDVNSGRTIYDGDPSRFSELKGRQPFYFKKGAWLNSSRLDSLTVGGQVFQLKLADVKVAASEASPEQNSLERVRELINNHISCERAWVRVGAGVESEAAERKLAEAKAEITKIAGSLGADGITVFLDEVDRLEKEADDRFSAKEQIYAEFGIPRSGTIDDWYANEELIDKLASVRNFLKTLEPTRDQQANTALEASSEQNSSERARELIERYIVCERMILSPDCSMGQKQASSETLRGVRNEIAKMVKSLGPDGIKIILEDLDRREEEARSPLERHTESHEIERELGFRPDPSMEEWNDREADSLARDARDNPSPEWVVDKRTIALIREFLGTIKQPKVSKI